MQAGLERVNLLGQRGLQGLSFSFLLLPVNYNKRHFPDMLSIDKE